MKADWTPQAEVAEQTSHNDDSQERTPSVPQSNDGYLRD